MASARRRVASFSAVTPPGKRMARPGPGRRLTSQLGSAQGDHRAARGEVEGNKVRRAVVDFLGSRAVPLDGSLRTLRALRDELPPELWVQEMSVTRTRARDGGAPKIVVEGKGKELNGVDAGRVYQQFNASFNAHFLIQGASVEVETPTPEKQGEVPFVFTINFTPKPKAPDGEEDR